MLKIGDKVSDFILKDDQNEDWKLSDHLGKNIVIYFYPKDQTPGCTAQACTFRDRYAEFQRIGVEVVGISADSVSSHQKFKEKYHLPFTLLSDSGRKVMSMFTGHPTNTLGMVKMSMMRATYIIDGEGQVVQIYPKATPVEDADSILSFLTKKAL